MSFDVKIKDVFRQSFILIGQIEDSTIISNLKNFIKNYGDTELDYKTNVKGKFTGFESLIQNKDFHNFLKLIKNEINYIYKKDFFIYNAWGNILKKGDEVKDHTHNNVSAFCGILYLTENGPGTYFKDYDFTIEEKIGRYVLFDPILWHSVNKIVNDMERITVAFNMNEINNWTKLENATYIN
jgi:hypothetical protein